jgi:hypothetical protein
MDIMSKAKKMTQKEMILRHLQDYGNITTWEAIKEYGVTRISAVVFNLKKDGCNFDEEWVHTTNRYERPVSFKKYIFKGVSNA